MKKSKTALLPQESYSPEFKLRIVLEYVRSPGRKKHICRENNISAELLEAWHQEFRNRAAAIFSSSSSFPVQVQSAGENATADVEAMGATFS